MRPSWQCVEFCVIENVTGKHFPTSDELNLLQQRLDEVQSKARHLDVITAFAQALIEANSVDAIVWAVAKQAIARLGYVDCVVYLFDKKRELLVQRAAHGPKNPINMHITNPIALQPGQGIVGTVAATGVPLLIRDTRKDHRYVVDDAARQSEIAVPLLADDGTVLGVIDSEHPEANFYTDYDLEVLETIASMASTKLLRAQMHAALEIQRKELQNQFDYQTEELRATLSQLKTSNEELNKRNNEKASLLKEIHHRVKNNMQIVSSLLNLSMQGTDTPQEAQVFKDCQARIRAMAMVHERLYTENDLTRIKAPDYVQSLTEELLAGFRPEGEVRVELDIADLEFEIDTFIPLGLILNELVVNALKHAFPNGASGCINVQLHQQGEGHYLCVSDDGVGIAATQSEANSNAIGMELTRTFIDQLSGRMEQPETEKGTAFAFWF